MSDHNRIRICGLWANESKSGTKYLAGSVGGVRVLVFRNEQKRTESSPDYSLCIAPDERRDEAKHADASAPSRSRTIPQPPEEGLLF